MPDGHLPHLLAAQDRGHGAQPDHRCRFDRARRRCADLRVRPSRRRRSVALAKPRAAGRHRQRFEGEAMSQNKVTLTPEQADAFGRELDAIKEREMADLGEEDADYIRRVIKTQRALEVGGRALLVAGLLPPDWMRDPAISGRTFEWDTACPADQWRHSHNYMHHTHTNIVGMDRDIGYGILRMSEDQRWHPYYLGNPVYAFLLMVLFQYGVAFHEMETERIRSGEIRLRDKRDTLRAIWKKTRRQTLKDYVAFPLLAGPFAPFVLTGNMSANLIRNVWSYMIIFCGHFPDGTQEFTVEETKDESRGQWYFRQVLGSANLTGGKIFNLLSGNLSHQIEHHLFPDMPARRYSDVAPEVQEICERYGIPYNKGPLLQQLGAGVRTIAKLPLPDSANLPSLRGVFGGAQRDANPADRVPAVA